MPNVPATIFQNDEYTLDFDMSDAESGIAILEATINGVPFADEDNVTFSQVGENIVRIRAVDFAGNPSVEEMVINVLGVLELEPAADTYLKKGHPNKNFGDEAITRIQGSGNNSPLILFDQTAIEDAVDSGTLVSATLQMATIDGTAGSWTSNGKLVGTYHLTHPWTELGATWNCHDDADTSNGGTDCTAETWEMNQNQGPSWEASPSDEVLFTNDTTGAISWDVMSDVVAWLAGSDNNGWIVRKDQDGSQGSIEFHSRETVMPPKLRIIYDVVN